MNTDKIVYLLSLAGFGIVLWYYVRENKHLKDALSSSRAERYLLAKAAQQNDITLQTYKLKLDQLKNQSVQNFKDTGEGMTVEEALLFTKDLTDGKN